MENAKATAESKSSVIKTFFNLGIFQFLTFLRRGTFYTYMITYLYDLMKTVTWTAALGTLNMIGSSLGQNLLWGKICDKYKARAKLIVAGETIAAFSYLAVFLIHKSLIEMGDNFAAGLSIIFGLSILEFFWSMSDVGWAALLTDVTTTSIRGKVVGTLNFVASLGRMAGIGYSSILFNGGAGFRNGTIFYVVMGLLLSGAVLMAFISTRTKTAYRTIEQPSQSSTEGTVVNVEPRRSRAYTWFLASLVIIVLGAASINQIFLLFLQLPQGLNFSDVEMGIVLQAWTIGGMIASLIAGGLADKFGRKKVLLAGLLLGTATPLLYSATLTAPLTAIIYGLNGIAFWTMQTVGFVLAGDFIPKGKRGRLFSMYNTVLALSWGPAGFLIGGPFADLQTSQFGVSPHTAYVNAFYLSAALVFIGTVVFAFKVREPQRNESLLKK